MYFSLSVKCCLSVTYCDYVGENNHEKDYVVGLMKDSIIIEFATFFC